MNLSEYIKKPLDDRQSHIDLSEPCVIHPIKGRVLKMMPLRRQHYDVNDIQDDLNNLNDCHVCHLCREEECRSYYHTYLGTAKENFSDRVLEGSYRGEGEWYNNGYFEIKLTGKMIVPKGYKKGRLELVARKMSSTRLNHGIKNATNGEINIQVKTNLGEVLPEGFKWGSVQKRTEKTCPHCNKTGKGPNMARYHFDNCKSRVKPL